MTDIVLIRAFDQPIGADYLDAAAAALGWCRELYGVMAQLHFLAPDGLRCACIFAAPDAEAVRNVIRAGKRGEPDALWACTIHPAAGDDGRSDPGHATRALILVERTFEQPVVFDDLLAVGARNIACFDLHDVRHARSYFSTDRRRMICLYQAPDAEAVRKANRTAGLPFDRAWPARVLVPEMAS
jgi:hypothetical protein